MNKYLIRLLHRDIAAIKKRHLTYLDEKAMVELKSCILNIEKKGIEGCFLEAGCALGGSSILIAKNKHKARALKVYDVFGLIPAPSEKDGEDVQTRFAKIKDGESNGIGGGKYYGYEEELLQKVKKNFIDFNISLEKEQIHFIQGLYEDTMVNLKEPIAFAHIDCDWYDSVIVCLEHIVPNLMRGGVLIIDDYYAWSGCTKAIDDFFKENKNEFVFEEKARLHITKR